MARADLSVKWKNLTANSFEQAVADLKGSIRAGFSDALASMTPQSAYLAA